MVPPNNRQARIDHGNLCCRTLCGIEATLGINGAGGTGGICSDAGVYGVLAANVPGGTAVGHEYWRRHDEGDSLPVRGRLRAGLRAWRGAPRGVGLRIGGGLRVRARL